mmetsp:Transcript_22108/g.52590  ORF Transcript_22108/g.52590 Transcript_22108/m.52590 type:complete len:139 (+) Transcript_22108:136-552(+)
MSNPDASIRPVLEKAAEAEKPHMHFLPFLVGKKNSSEVLVIYWVATDFRVLIFQKGRFVEHSDDYFVGRMTGVSFSCQKRLSAIIYSMAIVGTTMQVMQMKTNSTSMNPTFINRAFVGVYNLLYSSVSSSGAFFDSDN